MRIKGHVWRQAFICMRWLTSYFKMCIFFIHFVMPHCILLFCHAFRYAIFCINSSVRKRTIITPHILLFTLVFHYADVTLCMTLSARILILVTLRIDNQRNGLETQVKPLMLLMLHPWYGLIRSTLEPCISTLNIFQGFVFTTNWV